MQQRLDPAQLDLVRLAKVVPGYTVTGDNLSLSFVQLLVSQFDKDNRESRSSKLFAHRFTKSESNLDFGRQPLTEKETGTDLSCDADEFSGSVFVEHSIGTEDGLRSRVHKFLRAASAQLDGPRPPQISPKAEEQIPKRIDASPAPQSYATVQPLDSLAGFRTLRGTRKK